MTLVVDVSGHSAQTIAEIKAAIASVLAQGTSFTPDPAAVLGWTPAAAPVLDQRLRAENRPVQADTIAIEAHNSGFAERSDAYEVGGYSAERSLSGFTKPVVRIMSDMVDEGLLPEGAAHPMLPVYDSTTASYQKAQGFRMPAELVPVFADVMPDPTV